jgi:light-regulated signal transduction histidine kinase (bacteriophytochrome)
VIDTRKLPPGPEVDALVASGVHIYMAVPMISGGELIGAISFGDETGRFPAEQVTIAEEVAAQLAIAIAQARLVDRVRRHSEELEERVRERTAELEAFSYSVSHDLRAPLRAIDGFAGLLEREHAAQLDAEGRRLLAVVRASALRMSRLIDDLLNFSRLSRLEPSPQPLDMRELAASVVAELSAQYPAARVELGALPPAKGDHALLRQVLLNLVGNALKYSAKHAQPLVEIGGTAGEGGNEYWVRDNGAGFDPRYAGKLFGVFQRLHSPDEFEGTGVGLAIVQRIVTRHGGTIRAEAEPGRGATFIFEFPIREATS